MLPQEQQINIFDAEYSVLWNLYGSLNKIQF